MDKNFLVFVLISLAIHFTALGLVPVRLFDKKFQQKETKIKFVEEKEKKEESKTPLNLRKPPSYIDIKNPFLGTDKTRISSMSIKEAPKANETKAKTEINLITPKDFLGSLPAYMNYYDSVREKIKKEVALSYTSRQGGKVSVTFTIDQKGTLLNLSASDTTTHNQRLDSLALESVKKAAPFAKFPKELSKFDSLTFNIFIIFRKD